MAWSPQQEAALAKVRAWINDPSASQVFRLFGFAGTGKTTIAREMQDMVDGLVASCAYTGKAASVLAAKGLPFASTVHRLIYVPTGNDYQKRVNELKEELRLLEDVKVPSKGLLQRTEAVRRALREAQAQAGQPQFLLKDAESLQGIKLIICDEVSMIPERMAEDLLSFGIRLLVLGDPAQLPPVKGTGYFMEADPDVLLTEIHRQARDNPILELATRVREGRGLELCDLGQAKVVRKVDASDALAADQILCGTNNRRMAINARHRQLGGHLERGPMPFAGEKLVCLKNNHETGLLNGTLWECTRDVDYEPGQATIHLRVRPDTGGVDIGLPAEASLFIDETQKPQWGSAEWFTYGYCLTVHKSQGSQWDHVILFDDWTRDSSKRQWLYTGITRAAERLTVVI